MENSLVQLDCSWFTRQKVLLTPQFTIMYTVPFDGFNTTVSSYSFAISQHVLKKNVFLNASL